MHESPAHPPSRDELSLLLADSSWIVGLCRRLLGSSADADDLAQETAVRALGANRSRGAAIGRAWLAKTARLTSSETRRAERHRKDRELRYGRDQELRASAPGPLDALARAEFRERLAHLVMKLPEGERQAVVLRFYEGLDYGAMQASTGAQAEALRQRVSRGLSRLKDQLGAEERDGETPWRALALGVVGAAPGVKAGGARLMAAAALLLAGGAAATTWVLRGDPGSLAEPTAEARPRGLDVDEPLADLPMAHGVRIAATLDPAPDAAPRAAAGEAQTIEVRIVDEATGLPAAGLGWRVILTGDFDLGQRNAWWQFGPSGPYYPNPEPIASGVTGDGGVASFALPKHDLVNLVTDRSERFARGSFPIEVVNGEAKPSQVAVNAGRAMFGRVVDDRREPFPGVVLVEETYDGEPVVLGTTDANGRYRIERLANFPRSFKRVYAGGEPTAEIRAATQRATSLELWPSLEEFQLRRGRPRSVSYYLGRGSEDEERNHTLWRWRRLSGSVLDADGQPVPDARVALASYGNSGSVVAHQLEPSMRTGPDGTFELHLKHNDLATDGSSDRRIVAEAPDGSMAVEHCASLSYGEAAEGLRLVLGSSAFVRVVLRDPVGDVRQLAVPYRGGTVHFATEEHAGVNQVLPKFTGRRLEFTLWRDRLPKGPTGEVGCTVLLPGYEPVDLDLSGTSGLLNVELQRRPSLPVTVKLTGDGAPYVQSLTLRMGYARAGAPPLSSKDLARIENWELRGDLLTGVSPGEPAAMLARAGEDAYLQVTMHSVYGELRQDSDVIVLGPVDDEPFTVSVEAPPWGTALAGAHGQHPHIAAAPGSRLRVDLVDADSGEPILPWSVQLESTGGTSTKRVDYPQHSRKFMAPVGQATLHFDARGYVPQSLSPVEFRAGETLDLGQLSMVKREGTAGRLVGEDGAPVPGARTVWIPRGELAGGAVPRGALTKIEVAPDGGFLLPSSLGDVSRVLVDGGRRSWRRAKQRVELVPDGEGVSGLVQPWQTVRFRISGLSGPSLFDSQGLSVSYAEGPGEEMLTEYVASSRAHAIHELLMAPGRWLVAPVPAGAITFDPLEFDVPALEDPLAVTTVNVAARPRH